MIYSDPDKSPRILLRNHQGFTLVELLVVLVVISLTSGLLVSGFNNTWRNFDKLMSRDFVASSTMLPQQWFASSIAHAQLGHPNKSYFSGNSEQLTLLTDSIPNDLKRGPVQLEWRLQTDGSETVLGFVSVENDEFVPTARLAGTARLSYLTAGRWQTSFSPSDGRLPQAVKIVSNNKTWVLATPIRPLRAEIPATMAAFGAYEF